MRALMFEGIRDLHFREVDEPRLEADGDALVRPLVVSTCDLDVSIIHEPGAFAPPFPLGHEFVARVEATGDAVRGFHPGDVVSVAYQPSCGACAMCARGTSSACRSVAAISKTSTYGLGPGAGCWGGALSDLVRVPWADYMLQRLPEGVDALRAAGASDNLGDAWRSVAPGLERYPGASVGITANGALGLIAADIARRLGAGPVDVYSQRRAVLERAEALGVGAHEIERWPARLPAHTITVEVTAQPTALLALIAGTEPGGICTSTGALPATELPLFPMYMRGITLEISRTNGAADHAANLDRIARGLIDPFAAGHRLVDWNDAPAALVEEPLRLWIQRDG